MSSTTSRTVAGRLHLHRRSMISASRSPSLRIPSVSLLRAVIGVIVRGGGRLVAGMSAGAEDLPLVVEPRFEHHPLPAGEIYAVGVYASLGDEVPSLMVAKAEAAPGSAHGRPGARAGQPEVRASAAAMT